MGHVLIVNCTNRKAHTTTPLPAWRLYQGASIPELTRRLRDEGLLRHLWFVSALHGLVHSLDELTPYDVKIADSDPTLAGTIVSQARRRIPAEAHLLIAVEPGYLEVLEPLRGIYSAEYWNPADRYQQLPDLALRRLRQHDH